MSKLSEKTSRDKINHILLQKGWITDSNNINRNVTNEARELSEKNKKKLDGKSPDYVLYEGRAIDGKVIGVLEAKNPSINLDKALEQAIRDAKNLGVDLAIVANGFFCKTHHIPSEKPLFIDDEEVQELISYQHALEFVHKKTNSIRTLPERVINDRKELLRIFGKIDDYLWEDNIDAGLPRFMEFANFLFLKLLGESKKEGTWLWDRLRQDDNKIIYLNKVIISELSQKYGGIFEGTKIKKETVFNKVFDALDALHLTSADTDIKGDAFEYFLRHSTATKNDLGQYFTPRHIINAMVHLVSPTPTDRIYDPFCGTGGFLTESFRYLKQQINPQDKEQLQHIQRNVLFGRDASSSARIAKMNSILQGDGHSGIEQVNDSLEHTVRDHEKYSVGLTNIPFSQNKKNYTYSHLYEGGLAKNNGDSVCILHLFKALRKGGRMAAIVPEGFLFRKELANVRKFLTDNADLRLVASLPQGVFLPYTGVKTDIIFLENVECPDKEKHFWYFEVKNDGFTLNNRRRKIEGHNDLDTLKSTNIEEDSEEEIVASDYIRIPFEKIRQNYENWIGRQYFEVKRETTDYPLVSLEEICKNFEYGYTDNAKEKGEARYIRITDIQDDGSLGSDKKFISLNEKNKKFILKAGDVLVARIGSIGKSLCFESNEPSVFASYLIRLHFDRTKTLAKYLKYYFDSKNYWEQVDKLKSGGVQPQLNAPALRKIKIPLPPLSIQQEIVEEIDSYRKIIEGAKQVIQNWKPKIEADKQWQMVKLSECCQINPKKKKLDNNLDVSFIDMATLPVDGYKFTHSEVKKLFDVEKGYTYFEESDILLAKITPCFENGKCGIATNLKNSIGFGSTEFIVLRANKEVLPEYLYLFIASKEIKDIGKKFMTGTVGQQRISLDFLKDYKIPLPSIVNQEKIISKLEIERDLIKNQNKILEIYEQKISDKINSIWKKLDNEKGC